jgi:hypothetical protein
MSPAGPSSRPPATARPGLPARIRTAATLALVLAPAAAAVVWCADWRARLARTVIPRERASASLFDDADSLLRVVPRLAPIADQLSDSARVCLAAGLVSLLMVADQLDDIQTALGFCSDRMRDLWTQYQSTGTADASREQILACSWIYDRLIRQEDRAVFLRDRDRSASDFECWTSARRAARVHSTPPACRLPMVSRLEISSRLEAPDIVRAVILREAGLATGMGGDPLAGLELLRSSQRTFSGRFSFWDQQMVDAGGWPLRFLRYPDMQLPGDVARVLRRGVLRCADPVWVSLIPKSGGSDAWNARGESAYDPSAVEGYLRWLLACGHAREGDAAWFRSHERELRDGPFPFHRWTRQLAREQTGTTWPEPKDDYFSLLGRDNPSVLKALSLLDRLTLCERRGPVEARQRIRDLSAEDLQALVQLAGSLPYDDFLPAARTVAFACGEDDRIVSRWRRLFPRGKQDQVPPRQSRWLCLYDARLSAAQALERLAVWQGRRVSSQFEKVVDRLGIRDPQWWNLPAGGVRNGVPILDYVPGMQSIFEVVRVANSGELPEGGVRKSAS